MDDAPSAGAPAQQPGAERQWYYANAGVRAGPLAESAAVVLTQQGVIRAGTLVWMAGMPDWKPAATVPPFAANFVQSPPIVQGAVGHGGPPEIGDGTGGLIPYKNGAALAGYYVGIFSLIPVFGLILGPIAVVLGILGLRAVRRRPIVKGTAHAVVALVLGGLVTIGHIAAIVAMIVWR